MTKTELFDVVIIGGGPAGLSAALTLGRAKKSVLLCDSGTRRNAAAEHVHNFVTRDGTPPTEFRRIARRQLAEYPNVEVREARVTEIQGDSGDFDVRMETGRIRARRILLCTGMIDDLPNIDGLQPIWGKSAFICPYCHGWEVRDQRFAYLALNAEKLDFALLLRSWTRDVVALTDGRFTVTADAASQLAAAGVAVDKRRVVRLNVKGSQLQRIEFDNGEPLRRDVLVLHPPQRQVDLVRALGVELDAKGYVTTNEQRQTSIPGIYAAGDLVSAAQAAVLAAASGMQAAGALNHELTIELATSDESEAPSRRGTSRRRSLGSRHPRPEKVQ